MSIEEKIEAAIRETLVIDNPQGLKFCMKKIMKALGDTFGPMIDTIDQLQTEKQALIEKQNQLYPLKVKYAEICPGELTTTGRIHCIQGKTPEGYTCKACSGLGYEEISAKRTQETFDQSLEE